MNATRITTDTDDEPTTECPTCERTVPEKYMSGRECLRCEHIRADARDAYLDAEGR